jgi:hypothetical protein
MRTDLSAAESARQRVSDSKQNSANSQSTARLDMIAGQTVSVQNPTTKRWDKRGIIVEARDPKNRTFQVKVDGTIWTRSEIFLRTVHIPLTDPSRALTGPQRAVCDLANFPPLAPPLPAPPRRSARAQERKARETAAGTVNAIFTQQQPPPPPPPTREEEKKKPPPTTQKEGKKKIFGPPLPKGREKEEEREGQQPPNCSSGQVQAAAAPMGLPKTLTGQFVIFTQIDNTFLIKQGKSTMLITVPSLIAAGIETAVVTGGITGTAVYLTAGDADVVTGDQIKTQGGLHILELGHMEQWAIAMMCATILICMGTCGACCHKRGKSYATAKETKLRDRALGPAKELVHMGAHGADKLLQDVQTYHDMHREIVMQKMHQITPPCIGGKYGERPCGNPQCSECPKPRHIAVGYSNSRQEATILRGGRQTDEQQQEERSSSPAPSAANSGMEE